MKDVVVEKKKERYASNRNETPEFKEELRQAHLWLKNFTSAAAASPDPPVEAAQAYTEEPISDAGRTGQFTSSPV